MSKRFIGFRLRKELDQDIADAIKGMDTTTISELGRTGMRMALQIKTQKVQEVKEIPVTVPIVWRPKQQGGHK